MFAQFKRLTWKASLLATIVSMLASTIALAASGDLDTTFDGDGKVTTAPANPGRSDHVLGIAIQTNGKIIAAGISGVLSTGSQDFTLTRYNLDGTLDATFSGDGRVVTNFGDSEQAVDVAVQTNGAIVVLGQVRPNMIGPSDLALARYKPGGALDPTFSDDGKQTADFGGDDNGSSGGLAIQPDGKIVVAGWRWNGAANNDFAVFRYLSNGSLDTTFSGDGRVSFGFGAGRWDNATDLLIQSDGKIVVAGVTSDANSENGNFAVARLTAGGGLDTTFSGDGRAITNFGASEFASSIALQTDGRIVVAGSKDDPDPSGAYFALARYNTNGSLDTSFNGTGRRVFRLIPGEAAASDVIAQPDGKIVVAGYIFNGTDYNFALVRLNTGGSFDTAFSGDGKVIIDFGGSDSASALALQPLDGKYVLGGSTYDGTQSHFALARVLP